MKAVIPVAGPGYPHVTCHRQLFLKCCLSSISRWIQYVVNECIAAGVKEIILVTHSSKNAIENHFDKSFELEATLESRVKRQLLEEIQSICPKDVTIMHVRQGEARLGQCSAFSLSPVGDNPVSGIARCDYRRRSKRSER